MSFFLSIEFFNIASVLYHAISLFSSQISLFVIFLIALADTIRKSADSLILFSNILILFAMVLIFFIAAILILFVRIKRKMRILGISDKKRPKMGLFFSYMPKRDLKLLVSPLSIRGMSL